MNFPADFTLMLFTYAAVAGVFAYLAIRYIKRESFYKHEKETGKRSSSVSRLTFLGRTTWVVLKNPLTIIIIITVILTSLTSGYAASSHASYIVFNVENKYNFTQAVFMEFSQAVSKDMVRNSIYNIIGRLNESETHLTWYTRYVLNSPMKLRCCGNSYTIYVLLGLSSGELKRLFNISIQKSKYELLYAGLNIPNEVNATIVTARKVLHIVVRKVASSVLIKAKIMPGVPLLPVQSYIGTEPVTPPPKYVLVGNVDTINSICGLPKNAVTDVLIISKSTLFNLSTLMRLMRNTSVNRIWYLEGKKLYVISTAQIPTARSMLVALLSSATATVLCLAIASALLPSLRNLYLRLSIQGMPPWGASIINTVYTMLVVLAPGIAIVLYSYKYLGGVSAFNSLLSTIITWFLMFTYLGLKSKPPKLRTDVYSPPSQRYVIILKKSEITRVIQEILQSLQGNEFFELLEFESRLQGNEAVIHARLAYIESWGIGADMNILVTNADEGTYVNVSCMIWGIEEVSEAIMNNVLALLLSRVVGRLKSWELSQY